MTTVLGREMRNDTALLERPSTERYELKIVITTAQLPAARHWLRLHPEGFRAAHPPRQVNNLYLDTPDLEGFNANLSGHSKRRKIRLRWYGPLEQQTIGEPVLELKRKDNMIGRKIRQPLDIELDLRWPFHRLLKEVRRAAGQEWSLLLQRATRPTLLNSYFRRYFVSPDGDVRMTLDSDLISYDQRLAVRPNQRRPNPSSDIAIIEIKAGLTHAQRLQEIMGHFPVARQRSSKYVSGLLQGGP